jgi:hypothetical protein
MWRTADFVEFSIAREGILVNEHLRMIEKAIYDKTLLSIDYADTE